MNGTKVAINILIMVIANFILQPAEDTKISISPLWL